MHAIDADIGIGGVHPGSAFKETTDWPETSRSLPPDDAHREGRKIVRMQPRGAITADAFGQQLERKNCPRL
ncbi:hypothetical protein WGT02_37585 (plasmid) [Rhizobium sp. T1470]|uniref:hypothetical protein n=1 Tax=unclassified Rhizobium TaxID=2613769 RepID=UPI001AAEDAD3|nr:hypothetical protein [Rhizobium sp. T1473]MCA0806911.1 hypothetical protein [Rhizobium sp. T1473]